MHSTPPLLIDNDHQKWFVMSAYRQEKKAEAELLARGLKCFVPKRYVVKTLNGKKFRTLHPVVPNLVFLYASWNEVIALKKSIEYLQFQTRVIQQKRQVMTIPDKEMEQFMLVAHQVEQELVYYRPEELCVSGGEHVRVVGGSFNGVEGRLVKVAGKRQKRVVIEIEGLLALAVTVENPEYIEIIHN